MYNTFQSYFLELAFDDIVTGHYILNSNTDELKAAVSHRVGTVSSNVLGYIWVIGEDG